MRVQIQPEVKTFMERNDYSVIKVTADRECVGANCSEVFRYPMIDYKAPKFENLEAYDTFNVDGVTVYFEKSLEIVPEVTFVREHHLLKDKIRLEGLPVPPNVTHNKL